jgi:prepilin signal peptidase PulO-like enzyme (type II secretory pathway)
VIYGLKTKGTLRTKMPFAPFLAAGLIVSFFFGRELLLIYYKVLF